MIVLTPQGDAATMTQGGRLKVLRRIDEDDEGRRQTHDRWTSVVPRSEWHEDQCLFCRFYLPLEGPMGADWGACANPASPRNGRRVSRPLRFPPAMPHWDPPK
jgi:hypothetical protein